MWTALAWGVVSAPLSEYGFAFALGESVMPLAHILLLRGPGLNSTPDSDRQVAGNRYFYPLTQSAVCQ